MKKIIICVLAMLLSLVSLFMALGENAPSAALVMEQAVLTGAQPALIQTIPVVERPAATTLSSDASAPVAPSPKSCKAPSHSAAGSGSALRRQ